MNRFLRRPATNAIGLSAFTAFYGVVFLAFPAALKSQVGQSNLPFWRLWDSFLSHNIQTAVAIALIVITAFIAVFLFAKHKPYDEFHTTILIKCLAVSIILALAAIAAFFVAMLCDPVGIVSKFVLFITVNWSTVVAADLVYLLLCKGR
jgi:hypothetical protein